MSTYGHERIITETGIESDVVTVSKGSATIRVYTHGSINELQCFGQDVTAQRPLEIQLAGFAEVYKQRGGNPFMGPMAGRYDSQKVAQPGSVDIHGVFVGLPWNIEDIGEQQGFIQLWLPAERWKEGLKNYYYFAASKPEDFAEERKSLERVINATAFRYKNDPEVKIIIIELRSLLQKSTNDLGRLGELIGQVVDLAYPGEADLSRRISIEEIDDQTVSFFDEVWFQNMSPVDDYSDASGYHTYFNALLSEINMPAGFWEGDVIPDHYDDNLPDVRIRELQQQDRLGRRVFIIPEGELLSPKANQIIYKDPETLGLPEVAIENWRQRGNAKGYPNKARILKPGETSHVGIRIIVINGDDTPSDVKNYLNQVEDALA